MTGYPMVRRPTTLPPMNGPTTPPGIVPAPRLFTAIAATALRSNATLFTKIGCNCRIDVTQQHIRVAILGIRRAQQVGAAAVGRDRRLAERRNPALNIREVEIGAGYFERYIVFLHAKAALDAEQIPVLAP